MAIIFPRSYDFFFGVPGNGLLEDPPLSSGSFVQTRILAQSTHIDRMMDSVPLKPQKVGFCGTQGRDDARRKRNRSFGKPLSLPTGGRLTWFPFCQQRRSAGDPGLAVTVGSLWRGFRRMARKKNGTQPLIQVLEQHTHRGSRVGAGGMTGPSIHQEAGVLSLLSLSHA